MIALDKKIKNINQQQETLWCIDTMVCAEPEAEL